MAKKKFKRKFRTAEELMKAMDDFVAQGKPCPNIVEELRKDRRDGWECENKKRYSHAR